jgi:hypothetical protein
LFEEDAERNVNVYEQFPNIRKRFPSSITLQRRHIIQESDALMIVIIIYSVLIIIIPRV